MLKLMAGILICKPESTHGKMGSYRTLACTDAGCAAGQHTTQYGATLREMKSFIRARLSKEDLAVLEALKKPVEV
jgi:hypothetical protein